MDASDVRPRSLDFSAVADAYDRTRPMPQDVAEGAYALLVEHGAIVAGEPVLDVGCGTGQFTVPFFRLGAAIVGVDLSPAMLAVATRKEPALPVRLGDVYDLPLSDGEFGATIVSKLFQHLRDWRSAADEIRRVTRPGGRLILLNEHGAFRNAVRREFERRADEAGFTNRYLGIPDLRLVIEYAVGAGATQEHLDSRQLDRTKVVRYGDVLADHEQRLYAEFWPIPDDVYRGIVADVRAWIANLPDGLDTVETMHPQLAIDVIRWPG